jgi:hypothetical protein
MEFPMADNVDPEAPAKWARNLLPHRFKPGQSGNPGGKPVGARNKIQADFIRELSEDFEIHGRSAIEAMRKTDPSGYVRTVAALLPKTIEVSTSMDDLSDETIDRAILAVRSIVATQYSGEGAEVEAFSEQAEGLLALSEATGVSQSGEIIQGTVVDGGQPVGEDVERGS